MRIDTADNDAIVRQSREKLAKELTPRERRFAEEYLVSKFNATVAAIKAGYSKATADRSAAAWINPESKGFKPKVKAYVDILMDDVSASLKISAEELLLELTHIARGNLADFVGCGSPEEIKALPREIQKAIKSFRVRLVDSGKRDEEGRPIKEKIVQVEIKDDIAAARLLGMYHKLWVERTEHVEVKTFADKQLERTRRFGPLKSVEPLKAVK